MRWLLALVIGCSGSPDYADTCEPHAPEIAVCCPSCDAEDLDLSRRVWGAYQDCADLGAVRIEAVDVPCNESNYLGCAPLGGDWVQYRAGGSRVYITVAHELGHVNGHEHNDVVCNLMSRGDLHGSTCGVLTFDGCEYAVGSYSPAPEDF